MPDWSAKERDVIALLRDLRPFETAFGGAMPLDETGVVDANYGPAGVVLAGAAFYGAGITDEDRRLLGVSLGHLRLALRMLRGDDFDAWASLIGPYLADPADSGRVEDWRRRIAELDAENEGIRKENGRRRKMLKKGGVAAKMAPPHRDERVRLVTARTQLERHDRAVRKLAGYLRRKKLHPIHPRLMSEREEAAGNAANTQLVAYYRRVLNEQGRTHRGAVQQTAWKFERLEEDVEKVLEYREHLKLATCAEENCGGEVFSQNLCQRHYMQNYRGKKKGKAKAG